MLAVRQERDLTLAGQRTEVANHRQIFVMGELSLGTTSRTTQYHSIDYVPEPILHPDSQLVLAEGVGIDKLHVADALVLKTDATTLEEGNDESPAWWSTLSQAMRQSTPETNQRVLVTTGTTQAIDPSAFVRWEVQGEGENLATALATDTYVPYGKTLKLVMDRIVSSEVPYAGAANQTLTNAGTVRFDEITLVNAGLTPLTSGGQLEKVGTGTATFDGLIDHAGHTTINEGILKFRQASGVRGNITVQRGATFYATSEAREEQVSMVNRVMRVARSLAAVESESTTSAPTAATASTSNSLHFAEGSSFRIDLNSATYSTHQTVGDVEIGAGVKLEVNVDPSMTLTLGTKLENVLTWGGSLTGTLVLHRYFKGTQTWTCPTLSAFSSHFTL